MKGTYARVILSVYIHTSVDLSWDEMNSFMSATVLAAANRLANELKILRVGMY